MLTFKAAQTGKATEEDVNKVERQKGLLLTQRIPFSVSVQSAASGFLFSAPTQFLSAHAQRKHAFSLPHRKCEENAAP